MNKPDLQSIEDIIFSTSFPANAQFFKYSISLIVPQLVLNDEIADPMLPNIVSIFSGADKPPWMFLTVLITDTAAFVFNNRSFES